MKRCYTDLPCANRGPHKVNRQCVNVGSRFYKARCPSKYEHAKRFKSAIVVSGDSISVVSISPWYVRLWSFIKKLFSKWNVISKNVKL